MSEKNKKQEKIIYPDQLNITIRTSVPGYQRIEYKPSMTIKDSNEKSVLFNPLIKLNQSTIDKIPKEYKIKEFFNRGLFQSLLNYNGGTPAKNLLQATHYGYVDNNIKITLSTIFPVGSVIYIGKKPYAIGDVQWTTGDWKIDVKQKKEEIDLNKITDPKLYMELVREEIISGEQELKQLPPTVITGSNYSGPPVAQGVRSKPPTPKPSTPNAPVPAVAPPQPRNIPVVLPDGEVQEEEQLIPYRPVAPGNVNVPPQRVIPQQPYQAPPNQPPREQLLLPPPPPRVEAISPEEERLYMGFNLDRETSRSNRFFKNYFKNKQYYDLIKDIFNGFLLNYKNYRSEIRRFYYETTKIKPKKNFHGLSQKAYDTLCDETKILKAPQDGDCFFYAVADGINTYNFENQGSKIIYSIYGKTQLFTIAVLRQIVLIYIQSFTQQQIIEMIQRSELDVNELNEQFREAINGLEEIMREEGREITEHIYLDTLNNIYNMNANFLVYKPTQIPTIIDQYYEPFRLLTPREIPAYIKSKDYWANSVALEAICKILKISIIPIEKYDHVKETRQGELVVDRLKCLLTDNDLIRENCSNKIMFLFYSGNHYELIRFAYKTKQIVIPIGSDEIAQERVYRTKYYTIFKYDDYPPPINIIFLLYGSNYYKLGDQAKQIFSIYKSSMVAIEKSIKNILMSFNLNYRNIFIKNFDDYFPDSQKSIQNLVPSMSQRNLPLLQEEEKLDDVDNDDDDDDGDDDNDDDDENLRNMFGGQYGYRYRNQPYDYQPYGYQPYGYLPVRQPIITKNPEEKGSSKIAYTIIIDIELHPGTSLTPQQISQSKCNNKYNAIRKAFAEFTGTPYVIPPVYPQKNNEKKYVPIETKEPPKINNTRRIIYQQRTPNKKTRKNIQ